MSASKKKIKIQLEDAEGGKYNLSLEGNVSKEKIMKVFELMDLINVDGKSNRFDGLAPLRTTDSVCATVLVSSSLNGSFSGT